MGPPISFVCFARQLKRSPQVALFVHRTVFTFFNLFYLFVFVRTFAGVLVQGPRRPGANLAGDRVEYGVFFTASVSGAEARWDLIY